MKNEELSKAAQETSKKYIKDEGVFYLKLADGRLWCPSGQARGIRYEYREPSLKSQQDQKFKQDNFIAVDFEIAYDSKKEAKRFPCQLGIAIVRDGKIIDTRSYLIRPPHNRWSVHNVKWHQDNTNLTPEVTENALEFDQLWEEVCPLFENQFILAHNAKGTEMDILEKCLDYYQLPYPNIQGYLCTHELLKTGSKNNKLDDLCARYYINFDENQHHDAEQDAIACAKLFLAHLSGVKPMSAEQYDQQKNMPRLFNFAEETNPTPSVTDKELEGLETATNVQEPQEKEVSDTPTSVPEPQETIASDAPTNVQEPKETIASDAPTSVQEPQETIVSDKPTKVQQPQRKVATKRVSAQPMELDLFSAEFPQEAAPKSSISQDLFGFSTQPEETTSVVKQPSTSRSRSATPDKSKTQPVISASGITLPEFAESSKLNGKTVVLTGDFELFINQKKVSFTREERTKIIKPWIESMGAKVTTSISGKTNVVICGSNPGKQEKIQEEAAKGHLIEVLDTDFLNTIIEENEKMEKNTDTHNPLYGRRIAILGDYSLDEEKHIRYEFHKRGAIMVAKKDGKYQPTRTTHYCIIGRNTSQEELDKVADFAYDGYCIKQVPIESYSLLFNKDLGELQTEKNIKRNLKITQKYLTYKRFLLKQSGHNPYYGKELFVGGDLAGDLNIFSQLIGNIGGYANREFFDETQMILLSDRTVERLIHNEPDPTVKKIEEVYNAATDSLGFFNYTLITESSLLAWVKERCEKCGDQVTMNLLEKYMKSTYK